jgi:hypothetical protein
MIVSIVFQYDCVLLIFVNKILLRKKRHFLCNDLVLVNSSDEVLANSKKMVMLFCNESFSAKNKEKLSFQCVSI